MSQPPLSHTMWTRLSMPAMLAAARQHGRLVLAAQRHVLDAERRQGSRQTAAHDHVARVELAQLAAQAADDRKRNAVGERERGQSAERRTQPIALNDHGAASTTQVQA